MLRPLDSSRPTECRAGALPRRFSGLTAAVVFWATAAVAQPLPDASPVRPDAAGALAADGVRPPEAAPLPPDAAHDASRARPGPTAVARKARPPPDAAAPASPDAGQSGADDPVDAGAGLDGGPAGEDERAQDAGEPDGGAPAGVTNLPFVEPAPSVAVILEGESEQPPEQRALPASERPEAVIKVIVAMLAFMALAYLGGHRRVLEWERRLGVSQVITAGLPFIMLGMIARLPAVGILSDPVLAELSPLLRIGLGSVGFVAGFRFDAKLFQGLPRGTGSIATLSALVPSATVAGATAPLLLLFSAEPWRSELRNPVFLRDALILATAGAMTARTAVQLVTRGGAEGIAARIIRLEELAGVLGLAFVAAFFRQQGLEVGWQLPGMGWLLLTLGLGTALGLLFCTVFLAAPPGPDFLAITLGAISLAAGAAGYLHLSSVAVAFVAGVILANFPGDFRPRLREMLERLERPIYLLSLLVVGALWNVSDWRGWVLMPVFMAARLGGKWLAALVAARSRDLPITAQESRALAISPIGALAIAIVVNGQLLYPGGSISLVVSAVIGGGVLTEAFVQLASRRPPRDTGPSEPPSAGRAQPAPAPPGPAPGVPP